MLTAKIVEVDRLYNQMHRVREIRNLEIDIDIINSKLSQPGAIKYTDMPKSRTLFDKTSMLLSQKMEKENQLKKLIKTAREEQHLLEAIIEKMGSLPESSKGPANRIYQDILRYKYLYDYSWQETNDLINKKDDEDFNIDLDSQMRKLFLWNGKALNKFRKCQEN